MYATGSKYLLWLHKVRSPRRKIRTRAITLDHAAIRCKTFWAGDWMQSWNASWPLFVYKFIRIFQTQKSTFIKHLVAKNTFISQNLALNFLSFTLRICIQNAWLGTFATRLTRTLVISKDDSETSWVCRESGGFHKSDILLKFIAKTQPWTEEHVTTMQFIEAYDCLEQSRAGGKNFAKKVYFWENFFKNVIVLQC